jgi:tetratricopeptide (TPR) repeat protein
MPKGETGPMDQLTAHIDRAWDLIAKGDFPGALRSAERSLEMAPDSPEVHNLIGYVHAQDGRAELAVEAYERAIELDESFVEAMLNAADVKVSPLRDWDGAIALVDSALDWIEDEEEYADALLLKIDALLGKGDKDAARAALATVPTEFDAPPAILFALGRAHFETGDVERSMPLLERALELEPKNGDAHYYVGLVRQERSDLRGAALAFLMARDADVRLSARPTFVPQEEFEQLVRQTLARLDVERARVLEGALVVVCDMPGAEVVADGVDPRALLLLEDLRPSPIRAGRLFVYQRNIERAVGSPAEAESELLKALIEEIDFVLNPPEGSRASS